MAYSKLTVSILLVAFIAGCSPVQTAEVIPRDDNYYEERKKKDDDRSDVLSSSRTRRSGNVCEDEDKNHECKEMCKEMYRRIGDKKDCAELTVAQIEKIYELYEFLEDPDIDDLNEIDPEDFDVYLNVSIASLEDLIDDEWNKRSAREFLYWLIYNEEFSNVFEKEDNDYDTLTELLRKIERFEYSSIHKPFIAKIEDGRLMEVAINSGDEKIIEWFMDYIEEKNSFCQGETVSRDCFAVYCKIGDGIDDEDMENWLYYDEFKSYIEKILRDKINANNSDDDNYSNRGDGSGWEYGGERGQFKDLSDITSNWVGDLCGGLIN